MLPIARQSLALARCCRNTRPAKVILVKSHCDITCVKATEYGRTLNLVSRLCSTSSSPGSSNPPVLHSTSDLEFTITFPTHTPAYLKYRYITPSSVNMFTTVVPTSLEGKGVAKLLANAAFDWAVEQNLELNLTCWYLAGYLKRNPREDVSKLIKE
jgi:predicted GNAT family acetyltransferase